MPEKSGIDAGLAVLAAGDAVWPNAGIAPAADKATNTSKFHRCARMIVSSSIFVPGVTFARKSRTGMAHISALT
jgi:hypothetical protein